MLVVTPDELEDETTAVEEVLDVDVRVGDAEDAEEVVEELDTALEVDVALDEVDGEDVERADEIDEVGAEVDEVEETPALKVTANTFILQLPPQD